jgi:hypothetical protein
MKLAKACLRCTMEVELLRNCLEHYVEKELSRSISTDEIIEPYDLAASRRANIKLTHT